MEERDGIEVFGRQATVDDATGDKLVLKALTLSDYGAAREEALSYYRRQQIKTWTSNADLIPENLRDVWIKEAFQKASKITYEELPKNDVVDADGTVLLNQIEYGGWWMSSTPDGMLYALWLSARKDPSQKNISIADVEQRFSKEGSLDEVMLEGAAEQVGKLSEPRLAGNGEASPSARPKERRRRRRQRQ